MGLPKAAGSHHTAWISTAGARPVPVRYAVADDRIICFGDDGLAAVADGARVSVAIHEIAGGPLLETFPATVHGLAASAVETNALVELLSHVSLGRNLAEVEQNLERHRTTRRVIELVP